MFNSNLKNLRIGTNLTQKKLAKECGLSERGIQDLEYGRRKPNHDTLISLADYFDVSVDYLLGRTDNKHSHKS